MYQPLGPMPTALTIGAASELIRNDGFAFLYAKPGQCRPHPPYSAGIHGWPAAWAGFFRKSFRTVGSGFDFPLFYRIHRIPRIRRVILVICVRIAKGPGICCLSRSAFHSGQTLFNFNSIGCHRRSDNPACLL